ncbi:IclR family transcriptional regulator [Sphaerochaeta sp. S2]|nr:IclR family transcriptional regulator [Sphaerochaeta sp. S2]
MAGPLHRTTTRILDILEQVAQAQGITLSELSRILAIPKSSLHPLVNTLSERKYLSYNKLEERYYPGENLFVLGNKYISNSDILDKIKSILLNINEKTEETLYFGVLSNLDVLYLEKMELHSKFRVVSNPGNKLPAYSTGYGKALLSQFTPEEICTFYPNGTLPPITEHTVANVEKLNAQLEEIRKNGFSYEIEESTVGIRCIAVPIQVEGETLAGMSLAVPVFRYTEEKEMQFKQLLQEAKVQIERIIAEDRKHWIYSKGKM